MPTSTPPGWHPDPVGGHELRYWDGTTWTAHVSDGGRQSTDALAGLGVPQAQGAGSTGTPKVPVASGIFAWAAVSVAALAVGSLGPWITLGAISVNGTGHGRDGTVTLVIAGLALIALAFRQWVWGVGICGLLGLIVAAVDIADINSRDSQFFGLSPQPGWGIILCALAGVSLIAWPFVARTATRS